MQLEIMGCDQALSATPVGKALEDNDADTSSAFWFSPIVYFLSDCNFFKVDRKVLHFSMKSLTQSGMLYLIVMINYR